MSTPPTLVPFLYKTRTIQNGAAPGAIRLLARELHTSSPRLLPRHRPSSANSAPYEPVPFLLAPDQVPTLRNKDVPDSTMTATEMDVFDKIFRDIRLRRLRSAGPGGLAGMRPGMGATQLGRQLQDDAGAAAAKAREKILAKYPPSLRRAAEVALGVNGDATNMVGDGHEQGTGRGTRQEEQVAAQQDENAGRQEQKSLQAFHRKERARFMGSMKAAKEDIDVWILLRSVFAMARGLGIQDSPLYQETAKRAVKQKERTIEKQRKSFMKKAEKTVKAQIREEGRKLHQVPAAEKEMNIELETDKLMAEWKAEQPVVVVEEPPPLDMDRDGPLFSVHLLDALRFLDRGFATPSALTHVMLPRIAEMGVASRMLGASTRFCNELLAIQWYRRGDLPAALRLLQEMYRSGITGNERTLEVVDDMLRSLRALGRNPDQQTAAAANTGPSSFSALLATTPGYDSNALLALGRWHDAISASIEEEINSLPCVPSPRQRQLLVEA